MANKKCLEKKNLSNNKSLFYSKHTHQGLTGALLVELCFAVLFEEPQKGHSLLFCTPSAPPVNIKGKKKKHTNVISVICGSDKLEECLNLIAYKI